MESISGMSGRIVTELTGMAHLSASAGEGPACRLREEKGAASDARPVVEVGLQGNTAGPRGEGRKTGHDKSGRSRPGQPVGA